MQKRNRYAVYDFIKHLDYYDSRIVWKIWDGVIPIRNHFSEKDWFGIVSDIPSDTMLFEACQKGYLQVYLLYSKNNNQIIGFVYILINDSTRGIVSVHGGGWSYKSNYLFPYAFIVMNEKLLKGGWKVHSSCLINNPRADRFSKRLGFVTYDKGEKYYYKYTTLRLIRATIYYKRFHKLSFNEFKKI